MRLPEARAHSLSRCHPRASPRFHLASQVAEAAAGSLPPLDILTEDIYYKEKPAFIRGATFEKSLHF